MNRLEKIALCLTVSLTLQLASYPQEKKSTKAATTTSAQTQAPPQASATPRPPLEFGLSEDTPVKLKLTRTMSSKDAKPNEKVDFEVLEDIKVNDLIVVKHGAMAIGTVTDAHPKRSMGRGGKLDINIDYVQLVSGEKAPLRAVKGGSGGSHTGAMTGAMVATGILFFPAAPLFLFMHGKDITIPQGTEVTAYIAADTPLEKSRFVQPAAPTAETQTASPAGNEAALPSSVAINSVPNGADITIDGKFIGTTPSNVKLMPGDHVIVIEKAGFKTWQRTMSISPNGAANLDVNLERNP